MRRPQLYVRSDVAGDVLWLNRSTVEIIDSVKRATAAHVGARPLLVIPLWPGMYPILGKQAPLWEVYALFPEPESRQREAIARLRGSGVDWVLLADIVPEPRADLRFSSTHRLCGSTSGRISTGSPLTLVTHGSTCCDAGSPGSHEGRHRGTL